MQLCSRGILCSLALLLVSGCIDPKMMKAKKTSSDDGSVAPAVPVDNAAQPAPANGPNFPVDNTKLVDRKAALAQNPKLVEVQNRINATDPLTAASQSYFNLGSRAELLNMKHAIDLYKAENDKFPPFPEFEKMVQEARVPMKGLYRWQIYAYDDTTGELCILEDREYKKQEYDKAGLQYDGN